MDIDKLTNEIEKIFLELDFKCEIIGEKQYFVYNSCYCKITYLKKLRAFVIESADNIRDALNGVLEDGDLYYTDIAETDILCRLKKDIIAYYMD